MNVCSMQTNCLAGVDVSQLESGASVTDFRVVNAPSLAGGYAEHRLARRQVTLDLASAARPQKP